jgi:twinkle protein
MEVQEVRDLVGEEARDIIGKSYEQYYGDQALCPSHGDSNLGSFKWDSSNLCWHCFSCGFVEDIIGYYQRTEDMAFEEAIEYVEVEYGEGRKILEKETIKLEELDKDMLNLMKLRGISKKSLEDLRVKKTIIDGDRYYTFKYNKGYTLRGFDNGVKGRCIKPFENLLWTPATYDTSKPLIITEGQIDTLSIYEAGYVNIASVPNGGSNTKWISNSKSFYKQFPEVYYFSDNDASDKGMDKALKEISSIAEVIIHPRHKDANDFLTEEGTDKLISWLNKEMNSGIIFEHNFVDIAQMYGNGVETGIKTLDETLFDLQPGRLTILLGRTHEGKSTFVNQILGNVMEQGHQVFLYSGEVDSEVISNGLYCQFAGKNNVETVQLKYDKIKQPKKEILEELENKINGKLFIFDNNSKKNVFKQMEKIAKRHSPKLYIIDNYTSVTAVAGREALQQQESIIKNLKEFSLYNNTHVILVAHPRKEQKKFKPNNPMYEQPIKPEYLTIDDIYGSMTAQALSDNIIILHRYKRKVRKACNIKAKGKLIIVKNRQWKGVLRAFYLHFNDELQIFEEKEEDRKRLKEKEEEEKLKEDEVRNIF